MLGEMRFLGVRLLLNLIGEEFLEMEVLLGADFGCWMAQMVKGVSGFVSKGI